jgi:hypothetical protein
VRCWGTDLQVIDGDREITRGKHVLAADFAAKGRSGDPAMPGAVGTLSLYIDDIAVGSSDIVTQPGMFNACGDGICVGRDDGSPSRPPTRRRSGSPAARSTRSSSTYQANATSTTRHRSAGGS